MNNKSEQYKIHLKLKDQKINQEGRNRRKKSKAIYYLLVFNVSSEI